MSSLQDEPDEPPGSVDAFGRIDAALTVIEGIDIVGLDPAARAGLLRDLEAARRQLDAVTATLLGEVETILNRHPEIKMCAVAAAPDEMRGDEVAAFVILETGGGDAARAEQIARWALDQMAYYKVPGWIAFVDDLPVTSTQKVLRGELKTRLAACFEAGGFFDTRHLKKRSH